eukprot:11382088-Karenia_brevis.AAC.1
MSHSIVLPSGRDSKLYGLLDLLETGAVGRIGRAGLDAIKDRVYGDGAAVTQPIQRAFALLEDNLRMAPMR